MRCIKSYTYLTVNFFSVSSDEVERLARDYRMRLYRTSVKEDLNVAAVFQHLAENYVSRIRSYSETAFTDPPLPMVQIGSSSRPAYITPSSKSVAASATGNGYLSRSSRSNNKSSSSSSPTNGYISHFNNNNKRYSSGIGNQSNNNSKHIYSVSPHHNPHHYGYGGSGNSGGYASFSPQDYLNNPMFDTLHHRRYWPTERTITLRPLGNITKKNVMNKKLPINRNSCKVL